MPGEPFRPDAVETPAYVYELADVRRSHALLTTALPAPSRLYYSLKANPHPALLAELRAAGCHAEVCSPGELRAALDAGFAVDDVLYTGPGKRDRDIAMALDAGVATFSVDSATGLDQLDAAARAGRRAVTAVLRINDDEPAPGQGLSMTGVVSQFGVDASAVLAEPGRFASRPCVEVAGFHLYTGTNMHAEDALVTQFDRSVATARTLADAIGIDVRLLDLGGGFGAPFARQSPLPVFDGLADRVATLLDAAFPSWRHGRPVVAFESGRYLTATCGTLYARVLDSKVSHGAHVVVLEAGINQLGGMPGLRRLLPVLPDVLPVHGPAGARRDTLVAGPLCTPTDVWARATPLPDVAPGRLLAVPNVGAYGLTASLLAFLGHPPAIEVVTDDGAVVGASRLELHRRALTDQHRDQDRG